MSDSACVAARSHSPPSSGLELRRFSNAAADHSRESGMTPGETSYGGPPTGTTLHIKRLRERRTALSNHCHRRRRRRHSFRFNFFFAGSLFFPLFPLSKARDHGIRLSSSIHLRSFDLPSPSPFFAVSYLPLLLLVPTYPRFFLYYARSSPVRVFLSLPCRVFCLCPTQDLLLIFFFQKKKV